MEHQEQSAPPVAEQNHLPEKRSLPAGWVAVVSVLLSAALLAVLLGTLNTNGALPGVNTDAADIFDQFLTDRIGTVLDGIVPVKRIYRLSDSDMAAPEPNPACYGEVDDPALMQPILEQAAELLDGQTTLFTAETAIKKGSTINYYLDESIFAVTWKQKVSGSVYTFSEVKIAHASQFRRYLSGGKYNSRVLHTTTEMADTVNAVVAASGDYYGYRGSGVVVYNGEVFRSKGQIADSCYIDENGDLLFTKRGEIKDQETAEQFVKDNKVRFSLSFGPLMVQDGTYCAPRKYGLGEIDERYARAALCQMDELHYLVVAANYERSVNEVPTIYSFAKNLQKMGIPTAYALDGGQTATIVMNDRLMNRVSYGAQRDISDIIYFATAIPSEGK